MDFSPVSAFFFTRLRIGAITLAKFTTIRQSINKARSAELQKIHICETVSEMFTSGDNGYFLLWINKLNQANRQNACIVSVDFTLP